MIDVIKLENTCKGYYSISGSASPVGSGTANVVIASTIDSHVYGYFDDAWEGTNTYNKLLRAGQESIITKANTHSDFRPGADHFLP
ncbi:MAG: hypothetical protein UW22_C0045G0009 [Candidatus Gottesmanbacteria bacterium GW2011_GWB1_44_11c]|uniref:Uncharacterized protein n=2 Tax=Candidatus Gottesmaniibacteriota TaxID=1752720 RepID=A0A0G1LGW4_9BACT|nr:MAG: hypothetical protein UW22_C0045G0009 [Candidatus Gottesmanbacteria bacterium GW2011_GWB1_44_11c]KKT59179.1 MAG: hypothetical protein UW52_C0046G0005 [Candidatus Gottesmanbacteria bacterium GW2011_GWA1_44_24b]